MRLAQFMPRHDRAIDLGAAVETDPAAARCAQAAQDEVMDFDQSLPVPWEWWPASAATN
jgi:hypothetical protein